MRFAQLSLDPDEFVAIEADPRRLLGYLLGEHHELPRCIVVEGIEAEDIAEQ